MGVFKKLKDVLFDVEEDDEVSNKVIEEQQEKERKEINEEIKKKFENKIEEKEEENTIKEIKIPKEEVPERELIKSESTFNFPIEIEEKPAPKRKRSFEDDFKELPKKRDTSDFTKRFEEPKKSGVGPFKPTPIISPVYGILDQNYSKDDIVVKTETGIKTDLDSVRKKAYGIKTKETEEEPDLPNMKKDLKDKLEKAEVQSKEEENTDIIPIVEEDTIQDIETPEEIKAEEVTEEHKNENTLETDLFKLIDSMYEEKEEEEE